MRDERADEDQWNSNAEMFSTNSLPTEANEKSWQGTPHFSPQRLAKYELIRLLGEGGMGTVYLAQDTELGRQVALKTINRGSLPNAQDIDRFRTEAEAAAKLDHPNIASIYEIGESNGIHFIAMQWVEGETLDKWRKRTNPSSKSAIAIVRDIALAMEHAHVQGVVHRDLKPGNVMLDSNQTVRIVDFGLAKKLDSESQMTMTGQVMGTPSFMAPEQAAGDSKNVTALADVYAIGAILFYLLTGKPPFVGSTVYETLDQVQNTPAPSLRTFNPKFPLDICTICAKCLEKSPEQRYGSAKELAEDLERFLLHQPIRARRISPTTRILRWCRRNPLAASFMLVTSIMLSGMTYLYLQANNAVAEAQISFQRQVQTINELLVQIGSSELKNIPNSQSIRSRLLQKAAATLTEATANSRFRFQSIEDLYVQTTVQLAIVRIELEPAENRSIILQTLKEAEAELIDILDQRIRTNISSDVAIMIYGLDTDSREWWKSKQGSVSDELLLQSMRESALSDNLSQQLQLLADNPGEQVLTAKRLLEIRQNLSSRFPNDTESKRRLAGAYHNLSQAYQNRSDQTQSLEDLEIALKSLERAQEIRLQLASQHLSEKLQFEIAKGYYALGKANYSARYLGNSDVNSSIPNMSTESIRTAFSEAEKRLRTLSNDVLFSQDAIAHHATVLLELSALDLDAQPFQDGDLRLQQCEEACQLFEKLSAQNPLVHDYKIKLMRTQETLCQIVSTEMLANTADKSQDIRYKEIRIRILENVIQAKKRAENEPKTMAKGYLSLAFQAAGMFDVFNETGEAIEILGNAKSFAEQYTVENIDANLSEIMTNIDRALEELE